MKLIANWKRVLKRSWSVWCAVVAAIAGSVQLILPLFQDSIPRLPFAILTIVATLLGIGARVIEQKELHLDGE
jgi:membrane protein required for beta-lactamase induction